MAQPLPLRPREQYISGGKKTLRARGLRDLLLNCIPRNFKKVASTSMTQQDMDKDSTPIDMLTRKGKTSREPVFRPRTTGS